MNSTKHLVQPPTSNQKNVINSIMSFLPDNRPITSLQIVEEYEKCPKHFIPVHKTYDQDSDADLWRENILFGKPTTRYLCLSKSEGLPDYVVETLKIIAEKELPPKEFSLLSRTADTEQKAWRKKQITYKLSKRGTVTQAVTDIILCSKRRSAPEGFKLAGELNGVLVCYKTGALPTRSPPPIPQVQSPTVSQMHNSEIEKALNRLNLQKKPNHPLPPVPSDHDYEEIQASYQLSAHRTAPKIPFTSSSVGTLGTYTELEGVPFAINPNLLRNFEVPKFPSVSVSTEEDYDFHLERQILCTMKSSASKNPFFQ